LATTSQPPPNRDVRPLHTEIPQNTIINRIYDPDSYGATATGFRGSGPFARFDHHAVGASERGILYASFDFKGCLAEIYGDIGYGTARRRRHCGIRLSRTLRLLDLRGDGALRAGTIAQVTCCPHALAQSWSRYFYENPAIYGAVDGIAYSNAHNEGTAFALYERAADALVSTVWDNRLDDSNRRAEYEGAAREANLIVAFYM
jgi:hypothetical protein